MTTKKKTLIFLLWFTSGFLCWAAGNYLFIYGTSNLMELASKYLRSILHLKLRLDWIAFVLHIITELIIVFLTTFFLARAIGKRSMWLFAFILGVALPPMYVTINSNIEYLINYEKFPPEANIVTIKILIITIMAHLVISPLVAWLGVTLGNQYRMKKTKGRKGSALET